MIYVPGWKQHYHEMVNEVFRSVEAGRLLDVSIGTFRISQDYLKNMRKQAPDAAVIWFPFQKEDGYCHYPDSLMEEMECFLTERLAEQIDREKIFRWKM
jgi:spore photoproduct lyase